LLDKNADTRLGTKGGIKEILAHPFFSCYEAEEMIKKKVKRKSLIAV
jgi:hypothetical protein